MIDIAAMIQNFWWAKMIKIEEFIEKNGGRCLRQNRKKEWDSGSWKLLILHS